MFLLQLPVSKALFKQHYILCLDEIEEAGDAVTVAVTRAVEAVVEVEVEVVEIEGGVEGMAVTAEGGAEGFAETVEGFVAGMETVVRRSTPDGSVPTPNAEVTRVEDHYQKSLASGVSLGSIRLDEGFPRRPGYGTRGRNVVLWANYFELIPAPDMVLYRYHVAVQPTAAGKKLSQIIRLLLESPGYAEFREDIVTDSKSTIISRKRLSNAPKESAINYRAEGEDEPRDNAPTYRLRVEETGTLTVSELTQYLTSTGGGSYADKLPALQALNIFLGHFARSSPAVATIGSSKSFPIGQNAPRLDLGAGLTAVRGFFSSVRVATCRILVNVNVSHAAFYDAIPLDQLIQNYSATHGRSVVKLEKFLKRVRVRVIHLGEKKNKAGESIPRVKTIFGLANTNDGHGLDHPPRVQRHGAGPKDVEFYLNDPSAATPRASTGQAASAPGGKKKGKGKKGGPSSDAPTQGTSQGRYISVFDFFRTTHGRTIGNPNIPVVNVGNRENPSYLPVEVCVVMPGQSSQSKLDPAQTQQMIRFAVRKPSQNATSITQDAPNTVGLSPQANVLLGRFGVSVTARLITVPGRVLQEPKVSYKGGTAPRVSGGSWNMANIKFNAGATLRSWSCLMISMRGVRDSFDKAGLESIMGQFHKALGGMGISAPPPMAISRTEIVDPDDVKVETALSKAPGNPGQARLVFIVLPEANTALYNRVKYLGDVKYGVHTICVVGQKFAKGQLQYFANVALKFNLKLGGVNQLVDNARLGLINEDKTMVVGIDVTHPSPGSASNAPSVAGMVASIDKWLAQWPAALRIQESRKEMVTDLDGMLKSRLQLWRTLGKHKVYPDNLLIYRDGVSEGQYDLVLQNELPLLRKACEDLYPPADTKKGLPHITIIIVGKRHHTRFYPTTGTEADRSGNPKNGTVVDRGVTEAHNWDFFMQAHTALQGTARPAHYYIVLDEIFTKRKPQPPFQNVADVLEDLTHNMCYLFGRATKAVSICPPAYYADIVCERARCYLSGLFDMPTPSATPAQSVAGEGVLPEAREEDVKIHADLRDTMFYI
ncbi:hypothetical protein MMC30_004283 [Trapelia coarctata]|nr:hypothetical protein [Trapelia coarctata]